MAENMADLVAAEKEDLGFFSCGGGGSGSPHPYRLASGVGEFTRRWRWKDDGSKRYAFLLFADSLNPKIRTKEMGGSDSGVEKSAHKEKEKKTLLGLARIAKPLAGKNLSKPRC
ncbi:hypothetical protein L2E82_39927 [Cichorium intybus]|uniref:Uncharacterized protein n=1 Tax=Cichorium intybus TaxID=13427 RepID=A0ACB9AKC3_CICIN|nr:hypothetical protein L2E82_39927 [Cichorium intybus]